VATWLLAITRNLAIDRLRIKRAEPIDPDRLVATAEAAWSGAQDDDPSVGIPGPLRDAVAELPVEQRRALLLASLFGFTAREIGEIEGTPLGTAKTRIRSGMMKLRAEMEAGDER
jgi:RNA polymerase sigma-70 factor (ECF subfamily)